MACEHCDYKGFVETVCLTGGKIEKVINLCPKCKDVQAYSKMIKEIYVGVENEVSNEDDTNDFDSVA